MRLFKHALNTALEASPLDTKIAIQSLDRWSSSGADSPWGPDLAFVLIPTQSEFFDQLEQKKRFVLISENPSQAVEVSKRNRFAAIAGFVAEETEKGTPQGGFTHVQICKGYTFLGGPRRKRRTEKGYDFIDVDVDRTEPTGLPYSFGGVSGGGLWTFAVYRREGDAPGNEKTSDLILSGTEFYQISPLSEKAMLRCHGAKSVYEIALPEIRKWLARRK